MPTLNSCLSRCYKWVDTPVLLEYYFKHDTPSSQSAIVLVNQLTFPLCVLSCTSSGSWCHVCLQFQELQVDREILLTSNRSLADESIARRPRLNNGKLQLAEKYKELANLATICWEKQSRLGESTCDQERQRRKDDCLCFWVYMEYCCQPWVRIKNIKIHLDKNLWKYNVCVRSDHRPGNESLMSCCTWLFLR